MQKKKFVQYDEHRLTIVPYFFCLHEKMLRNEKKPRCKCGSVSKMKRPIPRFPKQAENENKEKTLVHSEFNELKKKRINRYRYILTRMRDDSQVKQSLK